MCEQIFDKMCGGPPALVVCFWEQVCEQIFNQMCAMAAAGVVCLGEEVCEQIVDKMCEGLHVWCVSEKRCVSRFSKRCVTGPICGVFRR